VKDDTSGLIDNIDKVHTTEMGLTRIARNLGLIETNIVSWCKNRILDSRCLITRKGKNWYAHTDGCVITVNAHSFTIITAHRVKNNKKHR
jgi:hypothetical protein